jgi:hypothetical protein
VGLLADPAVAASWEEPSALAEFTVRPNADDRGRARKAGAARPRRVLADRRRETASATR